MPPYRLLWLEIAERQYLDLTDDARALVDQGLALLQDGPAGRSDAVHDPGADQWSATLGGRGLVLYAIVAEPATVIVLRLVFL